MDVREAVAVAKGYLTNLYTDEAIEHLGLEEVEFDECSDTWRVTLGFSRPWDRAPLPERHPLAPALAHSMAPSPLRRAYKEIRQLDRLSRKLLARAWAAGAGPGDAPFTIDLDSTLCETCGLAKEGARYHGYTGVRGYHRPAG